MSLFLKGFLITINVPVVFMARYVMILRGATSLRGALEEVGPRASCPRAISGPKKVESRKGTPGCTLEPTAATEQRLRDPG